MGTGVLPPTFHRPHILTKPWPQLFLPFTRDLTIFYPTLNQPELISGPCDEPGVVKIVVTIVAPDMGALGNHSQDLWDPIIIQLPVHLKVLHDAIVVQIVIFWPGGQTPQASGCLLETSDVEPDFTSGAAALSVRNGIIKFVTKTGLDLILPDEPVPGGDPLGGEHGIVEGMQLGSHYI